MDDTRIHLSPVAEAMVDIEGSNDSAIMDEVQETFEQPETESTCNNTEPTTMQDDSVERLQSEQAAEPKLDRKYFW